MEGQGINNPNAAFGDVLRSTNLWLVLAALGAALLAGGQIAFLLNLLKLARTHSEPFRRSTVAFLSGNDAPSVGVKR